jgi:predicted RNA-binding protein Jag
MRPEGSVFEGKTLDDAVRRGLDSLRLSRAEAMITVIEEGSGGFLGFGARPYKVRIQPRPGGPIREPDDRGERDRRERHGRGRDRDRDRGRGERDRRRGDGRDERRAEGGRRRPDERGGPGHRRHEERGRDERREARPAHADRPDRGARPERGDRPGRGERYGRGGREGRGDRERPAHFEGEERRGRGDRERPARFEGEERRGRGEREERPAGFEGEERRGRAEREERPARFEGEERHGRGEREERPAGFEGEERRGRAEREERPARFEREEGEAWRAPSEREERPARFDREEGDERGEGARLEPAPMRGPSAEGALGESPEEQRRRRRRGRRGGRGRRRGEGAPATERMRETPGLEPSQANGTQMPEIPGYEEDEVDRSEPVFAAEDAPMRAPEPSDVSTAPAAPAPGASALSNDALAAEGRRVTEDLMRHMGFEATVTATASEDRVEVMVALPADDELLTGRKGETRQALQHLLNRMLNKGGGSQYHLQLEINDFWKHRESDLAETARALADEALARNGEAVSEYLNSQERRIIHVTLRGDTRVKTYALGTGLIKRVAVAPADFPDRPLDEDE